VVHLPELVAALDTRIVAGAALDVLPVEPVPRESPLISNPRVILTPHAAFFSVEAEKELRHKAVQNIVSWLRRGRPDYPVTKGTHAP
jgi:D-3-phosphoglycerate dehydrogenase